MKPTRLLRALLLGSAASTAGAVPIPNELDTTLLDRLYTYLNAGSFSVATSPTSVFSGGSMAVNINFQPSPFGSGGVAVGTIGVSAPDLAVAPDADVFSITIKGPSSGTLKFYVVIREDDNHDGVIDLALGDDEWQSPELTIDPAVTTTFNIATSDFFLTGNGSGDGLREFNSTPRMAMIIDIHSKNSYPGGLITSPRTIYLDHVGFYHGVQVPPPPPPPCAGADFNHDNAVNTGDLTQLLAAFGSAVPPANPAIDLNHDNTIGTADLVLFLANFGTTCP